ncbi:MAG: hypothetical protein ACPGWR_06580 [Ardenticatenaceae bacterium]
MANIKLVRSLQKKKGSPKKVCRLNLTPTALWSRLGNAIVIRQADGTFITFLEAGKGYAKLWVE